VNIAQIRMLYCTQIVGYVLHELCCYTIIYMIMENAIAVQSIWRCTNAWNRCCW